LSLLGALVVLGSTPAGAVPLAERAAALHSSRVGEAVLDALEAEGRARVIVVLSPEETRSARGARPFDRRRVRQAVGAQVERILSRLAPGEFATHRRYEGVAALAGELSVPGLQRLLSLPGVVRIDLDGGVTLQLAEAVPLVNLDALHAQGRTGLGVEVAVVDTGIDVDHLDLTGAVVEGQCFCRGPFGEIGCCPNGLDTMSGIAAGDDGHGHGTLVAGVLASNGTFAPIGGAPDASLISVRVIAANGSGAASDLLAGLDWVAMNRPDVDVVNASVGFAPLYTGVCDAADATTMAAAVILANLRVGGALTIAGSGNEGSGTQMRSPACLGDAVSVGAVWDASVGSATVLGCTDATAADLVACFSNSNSVTDLFAPGAWMTSSQLNGTTATNAGTSFAAPLTSACAALLYEAAPLAAPETIATALRTSSVTVTDSTNGLDFPRLDCTAAFGALSPTPVPAGSAGTRLALALVCLLSGAGFAARCGASRSRRSA
jgi:subtilisin family serine protease